MSKRALWKICVLFLLLAASGLIYVASQHPLVPYFTTAKFSAAVDQRIWNNPPRADIDLKDIADFEWDDMFVFTPYASRDAYCGAMSLGWLRCRMLLPAHHEVGNYLVFRRNGEIVHAEFSRSRLVNWPETRQPPAPIRREDARFTVQDRTASMPPP